YIIPAWRRFFKHAARIGVFFRIHYTFQSRFCQLYFAFSKVYLSFKQQNRQRIPLPVCYSIL
ncbi:MAG: hypothetical protein IJ337_04250, partial [Clostridia bacterium]|nr:hypothetical protein [Clostridia bacterium]